MARMRVDIPEEDFYRLMEIAIAERRPTANQAEVLLIKAIAQWYAPTLRMDQAGGELVGREKG